MILNAAAAQVNKVGIFENNSDIGKPLLSGSASYNETDQIYDLQGSGYNIWFGRDEFRYLYNKIKGDFILTANFEFVGEGKNPHRKIGWMIRSTADDNSQQIAAVLHGDGLTVLQWRPLKGAFMRDPEDEIRSPKSKYTIIQLERIRQYRNNESCASGRTVCRLLAPGRWKDFPMKFLRDFLSVPMIQQLLKKLMSGMYVSTDRWRTIMMPVKRATWDAGWKQ